MQYGKLTFFAFYEFMNSCLFSTIEKVCFNTSVKQTLQGFTSWQSQVKTASFTSNKDDNIHVELLCFKIMANNYNRAKERTL